MEKINKYLLLLFYFPINLISYFLPKSDNVWVFGSWFGFRYADNSKYFFEYCSKHTKIECVWLTKSEDVLNDVRSLGYNCFLVNSWKGIKYQLIAKVGVVCTGKADLNPYLINSEIKMVNLWHGTPLKKIMFDDKITFKPGKTGFLSILFPYYRQTTYDLLCSASQEVSSKFNTAFASIVSKIVVTGYSRNDHLQPAKLQDSKIKGIYMPTHRGEGDLRFLKHVNLMLNFLNEKLIGTNMYVDIKLHFYYQQKLTKSTALDHIRFLEDGEIKGDIYTVIADYDFLITDYSSIYFDYLLLDRPIIFYPFDIEKYLNDDREFYYEYEQVTPGPKVTTKEELYNEMLKIRESVDIYSQKRGEINAIFNAYSDGQNSKRVFNEIINLNE